LAKSKRHYKLHNGRTSKEKRVVSLKILVVVPCGSSKIWSKFPKSEATRADAVYIGPPFKVNRGC